MENNLLPLGGQTDLEPNRVMVTGARVKIVPPPGVIDPVPRRLRAPSSTTPARRPSTPEPPGRCGSRRCAPATPPSSGICSIKGRLNSAVQESVYFRVIVRIKGVHGGTEIFSDPFEFPVRVCYGCLQTGFSGPYSAFNFPETPACDALANNPFLGNPCGPAQDFGPILCCARDGKGRGLQCPGVPTGTAMPPGGLS